MDYKELMRLVLKGRSVNATAHALGIPQKSLDRYVKAETVPGCKVAKIIATEAGVPLEVAIDAIIRKEEEMVRPRQLQLAPGFATAAAALLVLLVTNFLTPSPAEAAPILKAKGQPVCIMSNWWRKLRQRLFDALQAAIRPAALAAAR